MRYHLSLTLKPSLIEFHVIISSSLVLSALVELSVAGNGIFQQPLFKPSIDLRDTPSIEKNGEVSSFIDLETKFD